MTYFRDIKTPPYFAYQLALLYQTLDLYNNKHMATKTQAQGLAPPPPVYIFREHKSTVSSVQLFDNDQFLASR